jgi:selenium metabolism protein YedF
MSEFTLDCQGLPCPQPVLHCKRSLDSDRPDRLTVLVDNPAARENVSRFLAARGYAVNVEERPGSVSAVLGVRTSATDTTEAGACEPCTVMTPQELEQAELERARQRTVVFITSATLGQGDDSLGAKLMFNFLSTLPELEGDLWRIVLVNGGVKLAALDSPALDKLERLAGSGVSILVCGTCLEFFGLLDKKAVGETTNMLDVVTSLQLATKVIQI